jgi:hypothetical protein
MSSLGARVSANERRLPGVQLALAKFEADGDSL